VAAGAAAAGGVGSVLGAGCCAALAVQQGLWQQRRLHRRAVSWLLLRALHSEQR
jgi:putative Ca2+/H+ antiporter (TMEM165/GDT1 family)